MVTTPAINLRILDKGPGVEGSFPHALLLIRRRDGTWRLTIGIGENGDYHRTTNMTAGEMRRVAYAILATLQEEK